MHDKHFANTLEICHKNFLVLVCHMASSDFWLKSTEGHLSTPWIFMIYTKINNLSLIQIVQIKLKSDIFLCVFTPK